MWSRRFAKDKKSRLKRATSTRQARTSSSCSLNDGSTLQMQFSTWSAPSCLPPWKLRSYEYLEFTTSSKSRLKKISRKNRRLTPKVISPLKIHSNHAILKALPVFTSQRSSSSNKEQWLLDEYLVALSTQETKWSSIQALRTKERSEQ